MISSSLRCYSPHSSDVEFTENTASSTVFRLLLGNGAYLFGEFGVVIALLWVEAGVLQQKDLPVFHLRHFGLHLWAYAISHGKDLHESPHFLLLPTKRTVLHLYNSSAFGCSSFLPFLISATLAFTSGPMQSPTIRTYTTSHTCLVYNRKYLVNIRREEVTSHSCQLEVCCIYPWKALNWHFQSAFWPPWGQCNLPG
jgi:hypothetical protein